MVLRTDKVSFTENYVKSNNANIEKDETGDQSGTNIEQENLIANKEISTESVHCNEVVSNEEFVVKCPCGGNKDDGIMIMCENCKNWQHSVCFCITEEDLVPEIHICDLCADSNSILVPTDKKLKELSTDDRQEFCLIRRAVVYCKSFDVIEPGQLAEILGVEINIAKGVFHTLQKEGVLTNPKRKTKNKGLSKVVDKVALQTLLNKKFFIETNTNTTKEITTEKVNLKRKRNQTEIVNLSKSTDDMRIGDNSLNILNASQDSLNDGQFKKRRRSCIVKTPVVASRH